MTKRLISFLLILVFLVAIPLSARYRYNPYTRKLDFYEAAGDIVLGDIGDITLTGLANGDLLYYNGTAWVNLTVGAGATVLTVAGGIPSWQAAGAPAAHAASHEVGGADLVDHDQLTNYLAAQHLTLPNTIVAVLTDHNAAAHVALGFLALPSTIAAVLTDHNKAAHDALLIDADTVDGEHAAAIVTNARVKAHFPDTIANILSDHNLAAHTALGLFDASADVDHNATTNYAANQHVVLPNTIANVLSDHNLATHTALGLFDASADVDHNATTNYAANQHVVLPATIAAVLTDHNLAAHTALGLFDASGDVDHDLTTNYVANEHIDWTAAASAFSNSGTFLQTGDVTINEDVFIAWADAADHMTVIQNSETGIENQALIYIEDARDGATADEAIEATLYINTVGAYAFYISQGEALFDDDVTMTNDFDLSWTLAADNADITQTAVAGIATVPLINIDDDRTGATADTIGEATIVIDADGSYAMSIQDGAVDISGGSKLEMDASLQMKNSRYLIFGTGNAWYQIYTPNGAGDDIWAWQRSAAATAAIFAANVLPSAMTDHDNYLTPTFVLANDEGADANDYAGVVIGERAQADVKVAHYFDFYAMTGAVDGAVDPSNAELAAIFRFGPNGTGVPAYATTGGDVLFEGQIEVDGNTQIAGYRRADMVFWIDCFDHGTVASKYQFDWDITSLNTQGAGTNTVDTTPSEITLTTDNNAIGDNEGTRTQFAIIQRARQNRTEFSLDLKQTANTQFYCGWNTSGTNAMITAADEYVIVFFDVSDNANWQIKVGDGATEDVFTSAVAGAVAHIIHEIWVETDGTVHWRVNGTELDITGSVDNLMTASNHYLIVGQAQSVTGAAVIVVEIDYVENEKTKTH